MLKSCAYCGRVHDRNFDCGKRPKKGYRTQMRTEQRHIRSSRKWTDASLEVRRRDNFICQACIRSDDKKIVYDDIEVHHIEPLDENSERAFDRTNLISLCKYHHEEAEAGRIPRSVLHDWAEENDRLPPG